MMLWELLWHCSSRWHKTITKWLGIIYLKEKQLYKRENILSHETCDAI